MSIPTGHGFILMTLIVLLLSAGNAVAMELGGQDVLVPIVARTAGDLGTKWRTDLVIANVSRKPVVETPITITLFLNGSTESAKTWTAQLSPHETLVLRDVLLDVFEVEDGIGLVRVTSSRDDAWITARARVYNVSENQGQYGQTVNGLGTVDLALDAWLTGLSGLNGNRTNFGIANPNDRATSVSLTLFHATGEFRSEYSTVVPPQSVMHVSGAFGSFGTEPLDGASIHVMASAPVYAYATVVRNDATDAVFVTGTPGDPKPTVAVVPPCVDPAPLSLAREDWAVPGWIVLYVTGTDAAAATAELAARYGFAVQWVYLGLPAFFAQELTPETIAALRCELSVRSVDQNAVALPSVALSERDTSVGSPAGTSARP